MSYQEEVFKWMTEWKNKWMNECVNQHKNKIFIKKKIIAVIRILKKLINFKLIMHQPTVNCSSHFSFKEKQSTVIC